ncbi:MAG: DUF4339 domain-containing protein [Planctomycetota bacterium]|nr:DUF4339 domain-containing protein [Planctomycetota bacterium]
MGIRVACPNGHNLNVKTTLAGKRALCPKCGAQFEIPRTIAEAPAVANPLESITTGSESTVDESASSTPPEPASTGSSGELEVLPPILPPELPSAESDVDPIAELAGDSCWFVRLSSGAQLGPVAEADIQQWLRGGQIGSDSLVWRIGWSNWKFVSVYLTEVDPHPAAGVMGFGGAPPFVNLSDPVGVGLQGAPLDPMAVLAGQSDSGSVKQSAIARRRQRRNWQIVMTVGLVLLFIVMAITTWHLLDPQSLNQQLQRLGFTGQLKTGDGQPSGDPAVEPGAEMESENPVEDTSPDVRSENE